MHGNHLTLQTAKSSGNRRYLFACVRQLLICDLNSEQFVDETLQLLQLHRSWRSLHQQSTLRSAAVRVISGSFNSEIHAIDLCHQVPPIAQTFTGIL